MTDNQVSREQIAKAKEMDLFTYLQNYEPQELVKVSAGVYSTRTNDSLKISNGKWFRWSRGYGGRSALDYLVKVREMDFVKAVKMLCDKEGYAAQEPEKSSKRPPKKTALILPKRNINNDRVAAYLAARGIDQRVIRYFIRSGRIYEDVHHNCVFIGTDMQNRARYASIRSSDPRSRFLRDAEGSDKRYSFFIPEMEEWSVLRLFESAIDLLSYISLQFMVKAELRDTAACLSLSGVYQPRENIAETPLPIALAQKLTEYPQIKEIRLCLDNDKAGRLAGATIAKLLEKSDIRVIDEYPAEKDYNDQLMQIKHLPRVATRGIESIDLER